MLIYMGSGAALAAYHREKRIRALAACARACNETARHCLERVESGGPDRDRLARVRVLAADCLEFCTLMVALLGRGSTLASCALPPCAEAFRECAEGCEQVDGDEIVRECAQRCRDCEQICRNLADTSDHHDQFSDSPHRH
ncbi:MAG TPA: hypothetical protein VF590_22895 [Isosphaeraceae bacterium]|jgi:hypothetical protein